MIILKQWLDRVEAGAGFETASRFCRYYFLRIFYILLLIFFPSRLLDKGLTVLHKLAVKYQLPILATRRQAPTAHEDSERAGRRHIGDGGSGGAVGRKWGQLATARLTLTVAADAGHARASRRDHRNSATAQFAADGWAWRPSLDVNIPYD